MDQVQTAEAFAALLGRWSAADNVERETIERTLYETFQESLAILVLDMSGFSTSVIRHGIVHFLAKIQRMRELMVPLVDEQGGHLVKYIGDDILAVFPTAEAAFQTARVMMARVAQTNAQAQPDMQMQVAIGIGWGPCLYVPQVDVWGDQANRAFKLGEDTAEAGDILLTVEAAEQLAPGHALEPYDVSVSGVTIAAFRAL